MARVGNGRWTPDAYRKRRRALMQQIEPSRRCHKCGRKAPSWQALEFDHLEGRAWVMSKHSMDQRIRIMEREVSAGVQLRGACRKCNGSDGATRRYTYSQARWSAPPKRVKSFRQGQADYYEALRIQEFNRRWLHAQALWSEVRQLLWSSEVLQLLS